MIDCNKFIEKYYSESAESAKLNARMYINHANSVIGDTPVDIALQDDNTLCQLFYISPSSGISSGNYKKLKTLLLRLFEMCGITAKIPTHEEVLAYQQLKIHWSTLDELLDFIDKVGKRYMPDYNPRTDLVQIKTIAILGWYGFSIEEIVNARNSDLYWNDNIHGISLHGRDLPLDWKSYNILCQLASLYAYRGFPSGKPQRLKGDDRFLFRPTTSISKRCNENTIKQLLKTFNSHAKAGFNATISFGKLRKDALFSKIYADKNDPSTCDKCESYYEKIIQYFGCTPSLVIGYLKEYKQWLYMCHEEELIV